MYKLIHKVLRPFKRCQTPFEGLHYFYMLVINKVYLPLRDAKLVLRDSIFKLIINKVFLLLRDATLLLRVSRFTSCT